MTDAMLRHAALLATAGLFGGMLLFAGGFAAFLFKVLPVGEAQALIRQAFPPFYLFVLGAVVLAALLTAPVDRLGAIALVAIAWRPADDVPAPHLPPPSACAIHRGGICARLRHGRRAARGPGDGQVRYLGPAQTQRLL